MDDPEALFRHRTPNPGRLAACGFKLAGGVFVRPTPLLEGRLEMIVTVAAETGAVSAEVIDPATGEAYSLFRVAGAVGAFVGRVRDEYGRVLAAVAEQCFDPDGFRGGRAGELIRHVRERYGDEPEFLWPKFPRNAILRRRDNAKWYAALLRIPRRKLGLDSDDLVDILDLRGEPESLAAMIDGVRYFPGYHMNKKHWFTLCLDGSVSSLEIFAGIAASYEIAGGRKNGGK